MAQSSPSATTSVKLSPELKKRVAALAKKHDQSLHAFMVAAIEEKAVRTENDDEFLAASLASLEETERTGKAYAAEDVHRYLLAKVAGKKAPRPRLKSWRR